MGGRGGDVGGRGVTKTHKLAIDDSCASVCKRRLVMINKNCIYYIIVYIIYKTVYIIVYIIYKTVYIIYKTVYIIYKTVYIIYK